MQLGLFQKQTMNLVMTNELRQAIALLQYSAVELTEFLQEQAEENPLIELEEKTPDIHMAEGDISGYQRTAKRHTNDEADPLDFAAAREKNTREVLLEQMQFLQLSEPEQGILHYLILSLDDNGYLPLTNTEITKLLNISEQTAADSITLLQQLEPAGIGARDLKECLLLQAQDRYPDSLLLQKVITDFLEPLADRKWQHIARSLDITLSKVKEIFTQMQTLDPRPCPMAADVNTADYLYPDIFIDKDENGAFTITLNDSFVPRVSINEQYMGLINQKNDTSKYISDNYKRYMWLINSIEQRRTTMRKVAAVIVEKQQDFLENGFTSLNAMTMKEVAEEIDMHESTVSRIASNKVIRTPAGTFEMSKLFSSRLEKDDGDSTSSARVKILLKQYIDQEDKRKPYSDQKIADYFKEENGIAISRRTVAKYRDELNILSSAKRKEIV